VSQTKVLHDKALTAIRSEARIGPHFKPARLDLAEDGTATIEAEVATVAIKRLVLQRLAATPGITAIIDRVRVKPAVPRSDDGTLDELRKAYYGEPSFRQLALKERENDHVKLVRDALQTARGEIVSEVMMGSSF
jgi:hypothetical protein